LLAQLVRNRDEISQITKDIHEDSISRGTIPSPDGYFLMLESQIRTFDKVFIVVNALDECIDDTESNTRSSFLKALHQLPRRVHILFTSRLDKMEQKATTDHQLEIVANKEDLRKYLQSRLNSFDHLKQLFDIGVQKDRLFLDRILATIVEKISRNASIVSYH
jgi:hypothetical protein